MPIPVYNFAALFYCTAAIQAPGFDKGSSVKAINVVPGDWCSIFGPVFAGFNCYTFSPNNLFSLVSAFQGIYYVKLFLKKSRDVLCRGSYMFSILLNVSRNAES